MEKISFIGGYDKTDFLIYVAKMLTICGKKVLIIDTTLLQKARYVVPAISPTVTYITEYEEIDVAVGFRRLDILLDYLGKNDESQLGYDYVLVDVDSSEAVMNFEINAQTKNYFVTAFDLYSIKRGLEALEDLEEPIPITKVIFSREISKSEDEYLEYLALGSKVVWNDYKIYFPLEQGDQSAIIDNQRVSKIKFGNLSKQYKDSLTYIIEDISSELNANKLKRMMKGLE